MAAGSLELRLGNIEELCIIIIIIIFGGRARTRTAGRSEIAVTADTSRMEALRRLVRPPGGSDPFAGDMARMPLEAIESRLLEVNAELTRLQVSRSRIEHAAEGTARQQDQVVGSRRKKTEGRLVPRGGLLVRGFHALGSSDRLPGPGQPRSALLAVVGAAGGFRRPHRDLHGRPRADRGAGGTAQARRDRVLAHLPIYVARVRKSDRSPARWRVADRTSPSADIIRASTPRRCCSESPGPIPSSASRASGPWSNSCRSLAAARTGARSPASPTGKARRLSSIRSGLFWTTLICCRSPIGRTSIIAARSCRWLRCLGAAGVRGIAASAASGRSMKPRAASSGACVRPPPWSRRCASSISSRARKCSCSRTTTSWRPAGARADGRRTSPAESCGGTQGQDRLQDQLSLGRGPLRHDGSPRRGRAHPRLHGGRERRRSRPRQHEQEDEGERASRSGRNPALARHVVRLRLHAARALQHDRDRSKQHRVSRFAMSATAGPSPASAERCLTPARR